jgi:5'-phosphate synthase pdxT subunit
VQLNGLDGMIIPGGESTTIGLLMECSGLMQPMKAWINQGHPVFGTCAGMIMLADEVQGQKQDGQSLLGGLDACVHRNYFGAQVSSFESNLHIRDENLFADQINDPVHAVFIRAPAILSTGPTVQILATYSAPNGEEITVAARQHNILVTAFHPELTQDLRWHRIFLEMCRSPSISEF